MNLSLFAALVCCKTNRMNSNLHNTRAENKAAFWLHTSWHFGDPFFFTGQHWYLCIWAVHARVCMCPCVCSCVWVTHSLLARGHFDSSLSVDCTEVWQVHHWEQRCADCSVKRTLLPSLLPRRKWCKGWTRWEKEEKQEERKQRPNFSSSFSLRFIKHSVERTVREWERVLQHSLYRHTGKLQA